MNSSYRGTLTVEEIAKWIGKSEVFVRKSIENGSLGIGAYMRESSRAYYYISPKLAWERLGYRRDEAIDSDDVAININDFVTCGGSRTVLGNGILSDRHNGKRNTDNGESDSSR